LPPDVGDDLGDRRDPGVRLCAILAALDAKVGFAYRQNGAPGHHMAKEPDMASDTFVIRFPGGDFQYIATEQAVPSVGETIHRMGAAWVVTRVVKDGASTVYVERADEELSETG
jgi:hypothetical protein